MNGRRDCVGATRQQESNRRNEKPKNAQLFKETTGLKFIGFVARTRIEKARNLLQNPNLRISEVAFEIGFQSLSQFNRTFKKITGRSPSDYRGQFVGV